MVEVWGDIDIMIECFTPMGTQAAACVKALNCIINRRKVNKSFMFFKVFNFFAE